MLNEQVHRLAFWQMPFVFYLEVLIITHLLLLTASSFVPCMGVADKPKTLFGHISVEIHSKIHAEVYIHSPNQLMANMTQGYFVTGCC